MICEVGNTNRGLIREARFSVDALPVSVVGAILLFGELTVPRQNVSDLTCFKLLAYIFTSNMYPLPLASGSSGTERP